MMTLKTDGTAVEEPDVSVMPRHRNTIKQENLHHKMIPSDQSYSYSTSSVVHNENAGTLLNPRPKPLC